MRYVRKSKSMLTLFVRRNQLKVWRYATGPDGNPLPGGASTGGELVSLDELGIVAIELNSTVTNTTDPHGNTQISVARAILADGSVRQIGEYRLAIDGTDTEQPRIAVAADIAALPDLRGSGSLFDLHQTMQRDDSGQLKALVETNNCDSAANDCEWGMRA